MGEAGDGEEGDDGTIVREGVHAAAGHGCDAVENFHGDAGRVRGGDKMVGHTGERDAQTAGGRTRNAGEGGDGEGFVKERIGDGGEGFAHDEEAGQAGDDGAEAVLGSGISGGKEGTGDGGAGAFREVGANDGETGDEDVEDAEQESALDGPDGGDGGDLGCDGLGHAGEDHFVGGAEEKGDLASEEDIGYAHDEEGKDGRGGMRELAFGEGDGFVELAIAVLLAGEGGAVTAPFQITDAGNEDESGTGEAEEGGGPCGGVEESGGDDILDLRGAGEGIHGEAEGAEGNDAGDEALGDLGLPEHLRGKGVDGEDDDKEGDAAVGEHGADEDDGEDGALGADAADDESDDGLGEARDLNEFSENSAEDEDGEVELEEADHLFHKDAGEDGGDSGGIGEKDGQQGGSRGEEDDAEAAIGGNHQKQEGGEDDEEGHAGEASCIGGKGRFGERGTEREGAVGPKRACRWSQWDGEGCGNWAMDWGGKLQFLNP